ncbi:inositol monophosphatase [Candidatus Shapirobacteria bacterium]|nr:inositol monophosphatase [Candidatus Shapirobacteria bacterium]
MNNTSFVTSVLSESSKIANRYFGEVSGIEKEGDNNQVLTQADLDIGQYIIKRISEDYPSYNIIDEEMGVINNNSEYTWVIDPIDGTSNFAVGAPGYGIIIGLLFKDKPIAGGVSLPFYDEIITAESGKGAFLNNKKLEVTKETRLLSCLVTHEIDGHQENPDMTFEECKTIAKIVLGVRNLRITGSVFDGMLVAKGKYGAFMGRTSKIWDNVGTQVIIEESGGIFTDFFGSPVDYSNPLSKAKENFTRCMGSPTIHKQLQQIIHSK